MTRPYLTIVIPVYNEEEAVASVIEGCLGAREEIARDAGLDGVEIVVVNDGSKDRTGEIARRYEGVRLVEHPRNRGYGAALMSGFEAGSGDLLAFMDGDGTCDARTFGALARALLDKGADAVLGYRLGPGNQMPRLRRVGNYAFALLVSAIGGKRVRDTATGMRVFRRELLQRITPLPEGLHFTPAMTTKLVLEEGVKMVEVPIPYSERAGRSKLGVVKDGVRFAKCIFDAALMYRPLKLLGVPAAGLFVLSLVYGTPVATLYAREGQVPDKYVYRLFGVLAFVAVGLTLLLTGLVSQKVIALRRGPTVRASFLVRLCGSTMFQHNLILAGALCTLLGVGLNLGNLVHYVRYGTVVTHWIHVVFGGFLVIVGSQLFALGVLSRVVDLLSPVQGHGRDRTA